jgi:hypothetical protein
MKIIDVITDGASLLNLTLDQATLMGVTQENEKEVLRENPNIASLFNLLKFSIRELCTNYVPLSIRRKVNVVNGKYPVALFNNFIRVENVYKDGNPIKYKVVNRSIIVNENGEYEISYLTYPEIYSMFDELDFAENLNSDVIVFGLCAYYCLSHGLFTDFEQFHERYIEKANSIKTLKIFEIPFRRW